MRFAIWIHALLIACLSVPVDPPSIFSAEQKRQKNSDEGERVEKKRHKSDEEVRAEQKRQRSDEDVRIEQSRQKSEEAPPPEPERQKSEEDVRKEAEEARRLRDLFLRNQSVFIRKGELMLELNTFYNTDTQVDFVSAEAGVTLVKTTRRFLDTTVVARYGLLTDGLELDVFAPVWVRAEQVDDFGVGRSRIIDEGIGDIRAALRYQVWYEQGARPSLIIDAEGKSRTGGSGLTGTGNWSASGGITLLKTLDPVVLFGRVGYTYSFASEAYDLGNSIDYRIGLGFSLNDKVSFNIQLSGAYIGRSKFKAVDPSGAAGQILLAGRTLEIANLLFTTTVLITEQLFIEPVVGIGVTDQAFDGIFGIRLPYRF